MTADLRKHAKEARETFPKAAESARDFALAMDHAGLSPLAASAAYTMLAGSGKTPTRARKSCAQEMAKLFARRRAAAAGPACARRWTNT